ncbi:MAG: hypothetical protein KJN83_07035, partial [Nitrosopumilus sp.]|nr:hypothetical protein [Nitrosopumilus sp.]
GLISDAEIVNALETLIIKDVIPLDNFIDVDLTPAPDHFVSNNDPKIPSYQKDVFGFWSDDLVSDDEIVNSIGHLMSQGIINSAKIQGEIAERQAKFDQKMAELDAVLDSDSKFMDKIDGDDYSTTVINPDGSKTVTYEDETSTTFFQDGSRITHYPKGFEFNEHDERMPVNPFHLGTAHTDTVSIISKLITNPDGTMSIYEFTDSDSFDAKQDVKMMEGLVIRSVLPDLSYDDKPASSGGMEQLTQVTVLTIDTIQYPISQFTMWKWTGECDDAWHYHTPTAQAISADGETGIVDPDQENCGFGKVGEVFVGTWFMSQDQIDKFRERTDSDPLTNEAMMGGSDDGANTVDNPKPAESPVDVNPGPISVEESDNSPFGFTKLATSPYDIEFSDADGDGISDEFDDDPNKKSTKFGKNGAGLPGEIIDGGDLDIAIIGSEEFGAMIIEVGTDGDSESVIINVMGVDLEIEAGSILEIAFG